MFNCNKSILRRIINSFRRKNMKFVPNFIIASLFLLAATSCTHYQNYPVTVNAYSDRAKIFRSFPSYSTFAVIPKNTDHGNPLLYKEITEKIERMVEGNRYVVASNPKNPDFLIVYDFKTAFETKIVNVPQKVSVPVPVQNINQDTSFHYHYGVERSFGRNVKPQTRVHSSSSSTGTGTATIFVPQEETTCTTTLSLCVYDSKHGRLAENDYIWFGTSENKSWDGDAREKVDFLIASISKYFGKSTDKNISLYVDERDEEMMRIRNKPS